MESRVLTVPVVLSLRMIPVWKLVKIILPAASRLSELFQ